MEYICKSCKHCYNESHKLMCAKFGIGTYSTNSCWEWESKEDKYVCLRNYIISKIETEQEKLKKRIVNAHNHHIPYEYIDSLTEEYMKWVEMKKEVNKIEKD